MMDSLVKFGESKYINDMYDKEYLYFKPLIDFRGVSEETGRMDPNEGNLSNFNLGKTDLITDNAAFSELLKISTQVEFHLVEFFNNPYHKICSLYSIKDRNEISIDKRMTEKVGDTALVIIDTVQFFDILEKAFVQKRLEFSWKNVFYYDIQNHQGETPLHYKDKEFEYQNEFRILSVVEDDRVLILEIPGLKNCSKVLKSREVTTKNLI